MIDDLEPYLDNDITPEKEEMITENLIRLKFDEEKKAVWRKKLESEYKFSSKAKSGKKYKTFILILVAIAILMLSLFAYLKWTSSTASSPGHVQYAQNIIRDLEPIQDPNVVRKDLSNVEELRISAMILFTEKKFEDAITLYEALDSNNKLNSFDHYYFGICWLKLSNYESAVNHFNQSLDSGGPMEENNWGLALAYTSQNNIEQATQLLDQIKRNEDYGAAQASEILKMIQGSEIE